MTKQESTALLASLANAVLTAAKFTLAAMTGSIALLAEAYHSLADVFASGVVYCALRADRDHSEHKRETATAKPQGETGGKAERTKIFREGWWDVKAAIVIGLVLIGVAVSILLKVLRSEPMPLNQPLLAAGILGFLVWCSYVVYRLETGVGSQSGSQALIADGLHAKSDMLVSTLVLLILLGDRVGWRLDRPAAGLIGILIMIDAIRTLRRGFHNYFALRRGEAGAGKSTVEDTIAHFLERAMPRITERGWKMVAVVPGLGGPRDAAQRRIIILFVGIVLLFSAAIYVCSGFYTVSIDQQAIVERFGRPILPPVGPGLHYHFPQPLEKVRIVNTHHLRRMILGYKPADRSKMEFILWTNVHYLEEFSILTGEYSLLDAAVNVHYRVSNLFDYLYSTCDPDAILEKIGQQALREILGREPFFSSITTKRKFLESKLRERMQAESDAKHLGLELVAVCFRDMHPPVTVAPAFEDVVSAQEDLETFVEQSRGYRAYLIPVARGEAQAMVSQATAEKNKAILMSEGETASFVAQQKVYRRYPAVTKRRLTLETFEEALAPVKIYVVHPKTNGHKPSFFFRLSDSEEGGITPMPQEVPEWLIDFPQQ